MHTREATAADDEVAAILAPLELVARLMQCVESMVSCFVQVVAVQMPDLDGLLFGVTLRIAAPSVTVEAEAEGETVQRHIS